LLDWHKRYWSYLNKHMFSFPFLLLPWIHTCLSKFSICFRLNILAGIASGLVYLHSECKERLLHRDIKPGNVMLDNSFNANFVTLGFWRKWAIPKHHAPQSTYVGHQFTSTQCMWTPAGYASKMTSTALAY
jgi:serine/threonine protein kinase